MLVLSRKPGQKILIGDDITITIVRIGPNTVRVGIEAPQSLNIVREEIVIELGIGANLVDVEHEVSEALKAVKRDNRTAQPEGAD